MRPPPHPQAGFTLVELVIALFIFGLIAAAGVGLLAFSVRAQGATSERLTMLAADRRMSALLTSDLLQAVPRVTRDQLGAPQSAFRGQAGENAEELMSYVRAGWSNAGEADRSGLQRVTVRFAGSRIERTIQPRADGAASSSAVTLAQNVRAVRVRYRDKGEWRDRWDATLPEAMPRAVEMAVERAGQPPLTLMFLVGTGYRQ